MVPIEGSTRSLFIRNAVYKDDFGWNLQTKTSLGLRMKFKTLFRKWSSIEPKKMPPSESKT